MSKERFDKIDEALSKLTLLHKETRDHVRVIAEGFMATNERLDSVDGRLDSVDTRLGSVDHRLLRIETLLTKHDTRISSLEKRPPARR